MQGINQQNNLASASSKWKMLPLLIMLLGLTGCSTEIVISDSGFFFPELKDDPTPAVVNSNEPEEFTPVTTGNVNYFNTFNTGNNGNNDNQVTDYNSLSLAELQSVSSNFAQRGPLLNQLLGESQTQTPQFTVFLPAPSGDPVIGDLTYTQPVLLLDSEPSDGDEDKVISHLIISGRLPGRDAVDNFYIPYKKNNVDDFASSSPLGGPGETFSRFNHGSSQTIPFGMVGVFPSTVAGSKQTAVYLLGWQTPRVSLQIPSTEYSYSGTIMLDSGSGFTIGRSSQARLLADENQGSLLGIELDLSLEQAAGSNLQLTFNEMRLRLPVCINNQAAASCGAFAASSTVNNIAADAATLSQPENTDGYPFQIRYSYAAGLLGNATIDHEGQLFLRFFGPFFNGVGGFYRITETANRDGGPLYFHWGAVGLSRPQ